jgi:phosphoribosyl-AMP cyclohydrolase / phosphoribosyl-ATP pyrophosphohydrolase
MLVPSIDLMGGQAVQLVGGKEKALDAGDPLPLAERFGRVGEIAVIDLDAALRQGDNATLVRRLLAVARCRVGGGIRDAATAFAWLDAGAEKVILGTAAVPDVLRKLPRSRTMAALDAVDGEVVVDGWRTRTGASIADRMAELRPFVSGFLVTFVEREGRLQGTALDRVSDLVAAADGCALTIAGGITTAAEVAELDRLGADAQVGMALYTGRLGLADAFAAPLLSDRSDGLWPTVVTDARGQTLGLCWSNRESLARALETGTGVYWSRRRGLWEKGATSGDRQTLLRVDADCDRDVLRFTVDQHGAGFCHRGTATCFGDASGLVALERTVRSRLAEGAESAPAGSYTRRLLDDPRLLGKKLVEEAGELAEATSLPADSEGARAAVVWEAADVLYFLTVALAKAGISLAEVESELDRRSKKTTRRGGDAKEGA